MIRVDLVYGVQAGSLWLAHQGKKFGGWWLGNAPVRGRTREVAVITTSEVEYHLFFCYAEPRVGGDDRWSPMLDLSMAVCRDFWSVPYESMSAVERIFLPRLIASDHVIHPSQRDPSAPLPKPLHIHNGRH